MTRDKGYMNISTFIRTLNFCQEFGIEKVILHHLGEPLLHQKIVNCIVIAKIMGFEVGFTTNGTLLTHDNLIELKQAGLDKLDISYTNNSKDKRTLKNLYHISNDLGIGTWLRTTVFSKKEYEELKSELNGYNVRFQRGIYLDKTNKRYKPCKVHENIFVIFWDGTIVPCPFIYDHNQYTYGKIGEIVVDELKKEIDSKHINDYCNHCFEIKQIYNKNKIIITN